MRKLKLLLLILCMIFLLPTVYAGTAYAENVSIEAQVNMDGSMIVKETIMWNIDETLNGLYRDILIKNTQNPLNSASEIEIMDVSVNGKAFEYSHSMLQNGDSGKYNINEIDGGKQVKIFTPSSDEMKETVITYKLYDVVVEYNDIAELYWNFVGTGWDFGVYSVNIKIKLPGSADGLKVFAHGPLHGRSSITAPDMVTIEIDDLGSQEELDARVLFNNSLVEPIKKIDEDKLDEILSKEAILTEEANAKREYAKKALIVSIAVVIVALLIPLVVYLKVSKRTYKAKFNGKYYRELPEDYGPTIMNKVLHTSNGETSTYDMLATLLDLVTRNYVEIIPIQKEGKKKPDDYLLKLIKTDLTDLNNIEKYFLEELIFVDSPEIALKELRDKNSKTLEATEKSIKAYNKWSEIIEETAKEKGLIKTNKTKIWKDVLKCACSLLLTISVIVFGGITGFDDVFGAGIMGTIIGIFEFTVVVVLISEMASRTEKAIEHKAMWKAFKKFLLDFSKLDEHDFKSIAIWEHYLVYATALGISKKVIKELKVVYPTEFEADSNMLSNYVAINMLSDTNSFSTFESSFTSAASIAFSASSSADGSGGGFSGGAGGGRWRRRWRRLLSLAINKEIESYFLFRR